MSILNKKVKIKKHPKNFKYYHNKFPLKDKHYMVPLDNISKGSKVRVKKKCDDCGKISIVSYRMVLSNRRNNGKDYCHKCGNSRRKKGDHGHVWTKEEKRHASFSHMNNKHSDETKRKISRSNKKISNSKKFKEKMRRLNPKKLEDFENKYGKEKGYIEYKKKILEKSPRCVEYWLLKTNDKDLAKEKLFKFQSRGENYWVNKYGIELGTKKYIEYNIKRLKNQTPPYSKSSYNFFTYIIEQFSLKKEKCYYGPEEYFIPLFKHERKKLGKIIIYVDFLYKNNIIEYNGTYWHKNKEEEDKKRKEVLINRGYNVFFIKENELNDIKSVLKKVKEFLL